MSVLLSCFLFLAHLRSRVLILQEKQIFALFSFCFYRKPRACCLLHCEYAFSSFQKKYYQVSWAQRASSKVRHGHLTWNFTVWRKSMAKRRITPYQHSSNPRVNCRFQPGGGMLVDFYSISLKWRRMLYISASSGKVCFIVNGYFVAFRHLMLLESRQRLFPVWKPFRNKADFLTSGSSKIWFCILLHANETQHRIALLIIV